MKTWIMALVALLAGLMADRAWALCEVQASPQTYSDGTVLNGNVCDTNGALKISGDIGNVSISSADGAITDGVSAAIKATVKNYTNSKPLAIIPVDTNGDPATIGGGTQYQQGTVSTTTDTMNMMGCVRSDTAAVASGVIDGDRARCVVDSTGRLWVHVGVVDGTISAIQSGSWNVGQTGTWTVQPGNTANTTPWIFSISQGGNTAAVNASSQLSVNCANCSGSGVSQQDNTGFTPGTTNFVPMGGEVDDTGTTAVTENNAGVARITAQRAVHMNLRNNSGTEIGTSGNPLVVGDGSGAMNVIVDSGTISISQTSTANDVDATVANFPTTASTSAISVRCVNTAGNAFETCGGSGGSGGTSSNYGSAFPSAGTAAGFTDGTNMVAGRVVTSAPGTSDAGLVVRPISPASSTVGSAVPSVGVQVTGTDGTNARALKTDSSGELQVDVLTLPTVSITSNSAVNVAQMNGVATTMGNGASGTGVQRVTIANDSTGVLATVNSLTQMNGQTIAMGTGTRSAGTQRVTIATDDVVPASQSGTWTVQPGNTANTTPWLTSSLPATSGGTAPCYITSAATTNATNCKASAGQLYGFDLVNTTATIYYLRLYNLATAPTCSSATGFVRTIPIPASTTGAGIARSIPVGEAYGTGIGFCLTGGGSSTDNTNAATGVYVSLNYK